MRPLILLLALTAAGCSRPSGATGGSAPDGHACEPLSSIGPDLCPPTWAEVAADQARFCRTEVAANPGFGSLVSTETCRGYLRYARYHFDGGPSYCLYDPATGALRGYHAVSSKSFSYEISCGVPEADFDDKDCGGTACPGTP
jgi:hypothetical protein